MYIDCIAGLVVFVAHFLSTIDRMHECHNQVSLCTW